MPDGCVWEADLEFSKVSFLLPSMGQTTHKIRLRCYTQMLMVSLEDRLLISFHGSSYQSLRVEGAEPGPPLNFSTPVALTVGPAFPLDLEEWLKLTSLTQACKKLL